VILKKLSRWEKLTIFMPLEASYEAWKYRIFRPKQLGTSSAVESKGKMALYSLKLEAIVRLNTRALVARKRLPWMRLYRYVGIPSVCLVL